MGLLPSVCLEVMAQVLAAISTMEDLTAHRTHQGRSHGLEREHSHPSGYQLPLQIFMNKTRASRMITISYPWKLYMSCISFICDHVKLKNLGIG